MLLIPEAAAAGTVCAGCLGYLTPGEASMKRGKEKKRWKPADGARLDRERKKKYTTSPAAAGPRRIKEQM